MSFLHPWAFLGLLSLPAIIALHWHFERQRRVIVSSMFLWRFLDEKFQGRKISFLHISWLLLLDLLIALLLTLALTRPVVKLPALGTGEHSRSSCWMILAVCWPWMAARPALQCQTDRCRSGQRGRPQNPESVVITFGGEVEIVGASTGEEGDGLARSG